MDPKKRQQELALLLFGNKLDQELIQSLTMSEAIMLQQSAVQAMMMNRKDEKKFKMMEARAKFFLLQVFERLKGASELYVVCSTAHHRPYVVCDEKTFDDQIFLFTKEEDAQNMVKIHNEKKIPLEIQKLENKMFLGFYVVLYNLGVNALIVTEGKNALRIQLKDFVKEPDYSNLEEDKRPVTNPQLQLTGMYFVQELRRPVPMEEKKNLKDLEEEIYVNLGEGKFLVLLKKSEEGSEERIEMPMIKLQDGKSYEPVFTDANELARFANKDFKVAVMDYETVGKSVPEAASGIIVNPAGIRLVIPKQPKTNE